MKLVMARTNNVAEVKPEIIGVEGNLERKTLNVITIINMSDLRKNVMPQRKKIKKIVKPKVINMLNNRTVPHLQWRYKK